MMHEPKSTAAEREPWAIKNQEGSGGKPSEASLKLSCARRRRTYEPGRHVLLEDEDFARALDEWCEALLDSNEFVRAVVDIIHCAKDSEFQPDGTWRARSSPQEPWIDPSKGPWNAVKTSPPEAESDRDEVLDAALNAFVHKLHPFLIHGTHFDHEKKQWREEVTAAVNAVRERDRRNCYSAELTDAVADRAAEAEKRAERAEEQLANAVIVEGNGTCPICRKPEDDGDKCAWVHHACIADARRGGYPARATDEMVEASRVETRRMQMGFVHPDALRRIVNAALAAAPRPKTPTIVLTKHTPLIGGHRLIAISRDNISLGCTIDGVEGHCGLAFNKEERAIIDAAFGAKPTPATPDEIERRIQLVAKELWPFRSEPGTAADVAFDLNGNARARGIGSLRRHFADLAIPTAKSTLTAEEESALVACENYMNPGTPMFLRGEIDRVAKALRARANAAPNDGASEDARLCALSVRNMAIHGSDKTIGPSQDALDAARRILSHKSASDGGKGEGK